MKKKIIVTAIFFALSAAFTVLIMTVDVGTVAETGTKIGLYSINTAVHEFFGVHMLWYDVTNYLGIFSIAIGLCFAVAGLVQWIRRKKLYYVDREFFVLAGLYVLLGVIYFVFEKVSVNYRPVIMPGAEGPEASFPSSHTLLTCTILGTAMGMWFRYVKNPGPLWTLVAASALIISVAIVGRLVSGVHWATDIFASLLYTATLISAFFTVCSLLYRRKRR